MTFEHTVFMLRGTANWTPDEANKIGECIEAVQTFTNSHNHDTVYLGITAQAVDSAKWNGKNMPADAVGGLVNDGSGNLSWNVITGDFLSLSGGTMTGDTAIDTSAGQHGVKFSWAGTSVVKLIHHSVLVAGDKVFGIYDETNSRPTFTYNPDTNATTVYGATIALNGAVTTSGNVTATGRVRSSYAGLVNNMYHQPDGQDFSAYIKAGFYDSLSGTNAPTANNWNFLINNVHVGSGSNYIWNLQLSTGFWNATDLWFRTTNDGLRNPAWQHIHSGPGLSGSIVFGDSFTGYQTIEKYIDLGKVYAFAIVEFNHTNELQTKEAGSILFVTQNYLATVGVGDCYSGSAWGMRAWAREKYGFASNNCLGLRLVEGNNWVQMQEAYLTGQYLYIKYYNMTGNSTTINAAVYYRAFG